MKRRVLSVVLALVMLVSMAVPTFAISDEGTINGQPWLYRTTLNTYGASGEVGSQGPDQLFVSINVYNWCHQHTDNIPKYTYTYAYGNAYVETDNMVTVDGNTHTCIPSYGYLTGKVGTVYVATSKYFNS